MPVTGEPTHEHELKTWPEFFQALWDGDKTFELRKDDRPYVVGDLLVLREFDPNGVTVDPETQCESPGAYTERSALRRITYVLRGIDAERFGLRSGYCILGLE